MALHFPPPNLLPLVTKFQISNRNKPWMNTENSLFPLKSILEITSQPTMSMPFNATSPWLSLPSLDKENIAPPSTFPRSASSMKDGVMKNRKRKRTDWSDWIRVPLEDITRLSHPNNNNEVTPCAALIYLDARMERSINLVKRRVFKPEKMNNTVCLRKEFR